MCLINSHFHFSIPITSCSYASSPGILIFRLFAMNPVRNHPLPITTFWKWKSEFSTCTLDFFILLAGISDVLKLSPINKRVPFYKLAHILSLINNVNIMLWKSISKSSTIKSASSSCCIHCSKYLEPMSFNNFEGWRGATSSWSVFSRSAITL